MSIEIVYHLKKKNNEFFEEISSEFHVFKIN